MNSNTLRRGVVTAAVSLSLVLTARIAPTYAVGGGSDSTDRFLLGTHVNVGIQQNGIFGSIGNAPAGFHTRSAQNGHNTWSAAGDDMLGFTYDNGDGWGTGADIGDFFKPGSPYEGFALELNQEGQQISAENNHEDTDIGLGTWSTCAGICETWTLNSPFNGLGLVQVYSIVGDVVLKMHITVTNTTGAAIDGVYYGRCVDPDNVRAAGGDFNSANSVTQTIADDGQAVVTATATHDFVDTALLLFSSDAHARAFDRCQPLPSDSWKGIGSIITKGAPIDDDYPMGLAVDIGTLAAGASYTFDVNYGMTLTAAEPPPLPPTNTAWSPTSAMLAFAAALFAVASLAFSKKERRA